MKKILALMILSAFTMVTYAQDTPKGDEKKEKKGKKKKQKKAEDAAPKQ